MWAGDDDGTLDDEVDRFSDRWKDRDRRRAAKRAKSGFRDIDPEENDGIQKPHSKLRTRAELRERVFTPQTRTIKDRLPDGSVVKHNQTVQPLHQRGYLRDAEQDLAHALGTDNHRLAREAVRQIRKMTGHTAPEIDAKYGYAGDLLNLLASRNSYFITDSSSRLAKLIYQRNPHTLVRTLPSDREVLDKLEKIVRDHDSLIPVTKRYNSYETSLGMVIGETAYYSHVDSDEVDNNTIINLSEINIVDHNREKKGSITLSVHIGHTQSEQKAYCIYEIQTRGVADEMFDEIKQMSFPSSKPRKIADPTVIKKEKGYVNSR